MKRIMILLALSLFIFQACKKDDDGSKTPQESVLDYMPLTIGNYWVYENARCDSGELNCEPPFSTDTNFVTKDTLIDGYTYYKIEGQHFFWDEPRFYRDSGDYIVNSHGEIIFTNIHSDQTYNRNYVINKSDTLYYWYYQLAEDPENISLKTATYTCLDFRGSFFRRADDFNVEHNMHHFYSKDIGLVKETMFFASNVQVTKRELVGYYIQPKSSVTP